MKSKYDIFLSYSQRDSGIARHLVSKLEEAGVRCFIAEKDIAAGEQWEAGIREAIQSSERMLLLITPRSKNSLWVVAEAGAAWALGKNLIAALMFVEAAELIEPIRRHQARLVETPEQIEALVYELTKRTSTAEGKISGQWLDPADGDVAFFRQSGSRVVGFYDYGSGDRKVGVYLGSLNNHVFEYQWKWLDGQLDGHGRMILSEDGGQLSGEWWYGKKKRLREIEYVRYHRASNQMPGWIEEADFDEYSDFLSGD